MPKLHKFPFITVFVNISVHRCKTWSPLITIDFTWRMLFAAAAWRRCPTRTASRWSWGRPACRGPGAGPPCCPSVHHNIIIFIILTLPPHQHDGWQRLAVLRDSISLAWLGYIIFHPTSRRISATIVSMWSSKFGLISYLRLHPRCSVKCRSVDTLWHYSMYR